MRATFVVLLGLGACGGDGGDANVDAAASEDGAVVVDAPAIDAPLTPGCGMAGTTGAQNGTIDVGGTPRTYVLFVPSAYDGSRAFPLIFAWHGRTGSSQTARQYFGIEAVAAGAAIIVYPQGLSVSQDPNDTGWELTASGRDIAFYDALHTRLRESYCIGSTYSMGHSFGGYMSNSVACYRGGTDPGEVRAIAPIAGGGPFGTCTGDPVAAVIIHGTADSVVPFTQGEASRDAWRSRAPCATTSTPIDPSPCVAYDACAAGHTVRWCAHGETAFGGHGWPSWAAATAWNLFTATP